MNIGILSDPLSDPAWPQIKALLEPAAKLGGVPILEDNEEVWTVTDGGELLAAATGRICPAERHGEIILCGGADRKRWLGNLEWLLCAWFRAEGMKRAYAYGRKGWTKELSKMGWEVIGEEKGVTAYQKVL